MIGLVAIVKDEADSIDDFLDRAMALCGTATITDTGSSDATIERIRAHGIEPVGVPWQDFGYNRSAALELARGTADWLLMLDADMTVEIDPDFTPDPSVDAYLIEMRNGSFTWRMPLLLRGDLPWVSIGSVHEYTALADGSLGRREVTDKVRVTYKDRSSPDKTARYAALLEAEVAREPGNPRAVFYLAQTYREMGDMRAISTYNRRIEMGGWDQEVFYARFRAALLQVHWPTKVAALLGAWESRPQRLEPLHALLTELNQHDQHQAAYLLSGVPIVPTDDILFVHREAWDWGVVFERSIAAWWVGERGEANMLMDRLLEREDLPGHIRAAVVRNRAL